MQDRAACHQRIDLQHKLFLVHKISPLSQIFSCSLKCHQLSDLEHKLSSVHKMSPLSRILKVLFKSGLQGLLWSRHRGASMWRQLCHHSEERRWRTALFSKWHGAVSSHAPASPPTPSPGFFFYGLC